MKQKFYNLKKRLANKIVNLMADKGKIKMEVDCDGYYYQGSWGPFFYFSGFGRTYLSVSIGKFYGSYHFWQEEQ